MPKPIPWTAEQEQWLIEHVPGTCYTVYCAEFNKTFGTDYRATAIKGKAKRIGVLSGRKTRFGQEDATKLRPTEWHPNSGSFKKGDKPYNIMPIGSLRKTTAGTWQIKIEENLWYDVSRYLWEQEHKRDFPQDARVFYIDGDHDHYQLENVVVVPDNIVSQFSKLQSHTVNRDKEMSDVNFSIAKLKWAIAKAERERKGKKDAEKPIKSRVCSKCGRPLKRGMYCSCDALAKEREAKRAKSGPS